MGEPNLYAVDFEQQAKTAAPENTAALPEANQYATDFEQRAQQESLAPSRAAFNANAMDLGPDKAAEALKHAAAAGSDPTWTAQNLVQVKKSANQDRLAAQLYAAPKVAAYMAQGPAQAEAVAPDVGRLSFLEWALAGDWNKPTTPFLGGQAPVWIEGLKLGFVDVGSALMANKQAKVGLTPEDASAVDEAEQAQAAGVPGADTAVRKMVAGTIRVVPMAGVFGGSAAAGGGIGFFFGGPIGAAIGAAIGTAGAAYTLGFGPLYRRLKALTGEDGDPLLSEDEAKAWASGGAGLQAVAQTALGSNFVRALPGVSEALEKVGVNVIAKVASDSVARAAARRLVEAGGHVFSGALMMGAQGAIEQAALEDAKQSQGLDRDWGAIVDAGAEGFKSGLMLAPIAAFEPGKQFLDDRGRIHDASIEQAKLDAMTKVASEMVNKMSPQEREQLIAALNDRGPASFYVSTEHLSEEQMGALSQVAGPEAVAEARATGGSVAVPVEKYLTLPRLAEIHAALAQDTKISPDGFTPREAKEKAAELAPAPGGVRPRDLTPILDNDVRVAQLSGDELAGLPRTARGGIPVGDFGRWLKENVAGSYLNSHAKWIIDAAPQGLKKVASGGAETQPVAPAIPQMLLDAVLHHSEPSAGNPRDLAASHVFYAPVRVGEDLFRVGLRVNETRREGFKLYDIRPERMEHPAPVGAPAETASAPAAAAPGTIKVRDLIAGVKEPEPAAGGGGGNQEPPQTGGAGTPPAPPRPSAKAMDEIAHARMESLRLGDIQPGRYAQDARRAGDRLAAIATEAAKKAVVGGQMQELGTQAPLDPEQYTGQVAERVNAQRPQERGKYTAPQIAAAGRRLVGSAESALEGTQALEGARDFARAMQNAAEKAQAEGDKNRKFLLSFTEGDQRAELGKAGPEYLAQVDNLLSGFELGQGASRTDVARRLATMQWMAQEQAAGRDPVVPQSVLDKLDRFVHWKELMPQEMRDLRSAVENVAHLADLKNTLLENQQRVDRAQAKGELIASLNENLQRIKAYNDRNAAPPGAQRSAEVGKLKAALVRPEELIREMDGGKVDGPWSRYLWDTLRDGYLKSLDMRREAAIPIKELVEGLSRDQKRDLKEARFTIDGEEYSLEAALSVAFNSGSESNLSKMKRGWSDQRIARYGLSPWSDADAVHEQFLQQLDKRPWTWDLVEKGWQTLEGLKGPSFDLEQRLTGLRPEEVAPRSFKRTLADGTVRELAGGYYPMDYDPRVSREAWAKENNTDIPRTSGVFDPDYYRAATPQGHLIERNENFSRPTSLSIDALARHVNDSTKDIAMREALLSAHDILTDSDVRGALQQTVGDGGIKALMGFVRDTANELVVPDSGERAILQALRRSRWGLQQARYAFNIAAALRNLPNFANAAIAVPVGRLAEGLVDYVKAPNQTEAWVNEKSAEMRNRLSTFERDLSEKLREMEGQHGISESLQRWAMVPMEMTDKLTAYPAWLGSYREALASGATEETAVRTADRTVRLNVYAASVMDLPAIMRSPVGKMITLNYNFANMQLNQLFGAVSDARSVNPELRAQGAKRIGMSLFWTACIGTLAYELISGRAPTDESGDTSFDPADVAKWGLESTFSEPLMWMPLVRDVAGEMFDGREANISPLDRPFSAVAKTGQSLWKVMADTYQNGQVDPDLAAAFGGQAAGAAGYYLGLPVQQAHATMGYLNAVNEGDEQLGPDAPLGLIWGKKRKGSLREITGD